MERDLSFLPPVLRNILGNEDLAFGVGVTWLLGLPIFTLVGFYAGTILTSKHIIDIQISDMVSGGIFAGAFLIVGIVLASLMSLYYYRAKLSE